MAGGGTTTSTSSNAPPQDYLDAYNQIRNQATNVANTPYQPYQGNLVAPFSPLQNQGFDTLAGAPGVEAPYLNSAAQDFTNATNNVTSSMQPYINSAQNQFATASQANLSGALSPYAKAASQDLTAGSQTLTPTQFSAGQLSQYESPYTQQVVNATQAQFNNQNAQQLNQLQGNAASQGALGGDRVGVAQGVMAGQQQLAQAPVIAGLENQGYAQALNEFNTQQQVGLTAQQQSDALKQQAAQGFAGLGGQEMTAAQQQAAIEQAVGQGYSQLGQTELGGSQAQGWLNAQAGQGLAGLGSEGLQGVLSSGNALLGAGGLQQSQAQNELNIPYEQYLAQQAYPFQTTSWLSNIVQGLGNSSGSTQTNQVPGPSALSQGLGVGALAGLGGYAAYNYANSGNASPAELANFNDNVAPALSQQYGQTGSVIGGLNQTQNRGGRVHGFAGGGGVPDVSQGPLGSASAVPGGNNVLSAGSGVPDVSVSVVPQGTGGNSGGVPYLKRNYGTTSTTSGGGNDALLGLVNTGLSIGVGAATGNPYAGMATGAALSAAHLRRGGPVRGFAGGGSPAVSVTMVPNANGVGVPTMSIDPSITGSPAAGFSGTPSQQGQQYLNQVKATAAPISSPAASTTPAGGSSSGSSTITPAQLAFLQQQMANDQQFQLNQANLVGSTANNGNAKRGGRIRGFADAGAVSDPIDDSDVAQLVTTQPTDGATDQAPWDDNPVGQFDPKDPPSTQDTATATPPPGVPVVDNPSPAAPAPDSQTADGGGPNSKPNDLFAGPPTTGGFDQPAGTKTPDGPMPPSAAPSGPGFGMPPDAVTSRINQSLGDLDKQSKGVTDDLKNNLPMSLLTASLGLLAGRSHNPLVNVGEAGIAGVRQYAATQDAAKQLAAKIDENRARLAETQAWHDQQTGIRQQRTDIYGTHTSNQDAINLQKVQNTQQFRDRQDYWKQLGHTDAVAKEKALEDYRSGRLKIDQGRLDLDTTKADQNDQHRIAQEQIEARKAQQAEIAHTQMLQAKQNNDFDGYVKAAMSSGIWGTDPKVIAQKAQETWTATGAVAPRLAPSTSAAPQTGASQQGAASGMRPPTQAEMALARAAIAGGKDGTAVAARLKERGVDPGFLNAAP